MKIYKIVFGIWLIVSILITVICKLSFGVIFFDVESISMFINLIPFDFIFKLIRNYKSMLDAGIDFQTIEVLYFIKDFVLNICLFVPCGFCLKGMKQKGIKVVAISTFIAFGLEVAQLSFRLFNIGNAMVDINDIIAATIGSIIGVIICNILFVLRKKRLRGYAL